MIPTPSTDGSPAASVIKPRPAPQPRQPACILCQQRKVKCDRQIPCSHCVKSHSECLLPTGQRKRKKRFAEAELLERLRRYEAHLKAYGADLRAINEGAQPVALRMREETGSIESQHEPEAMTSLAVRRSLRGVENNLWERVGEDFKETEEIMQGTSDDDSEEDDEALSQAITKTYDAIDEPSSISLILPLGGTAKTLKSLHPSPVHIFRLWQTYLDRVHPTMKLLHAPTVQQQVLEYSGNVANLDKNMEALLFGIYSCSIYSLCDDECLNLFGEGKGVLLSRYQAGARQAFHNASLLRSSDMTLLQAFGLYLASCFHFALDPRTLYCLTGLAIRIAQRMGLNFDGTAYSLPPFETEMRRRLWWQLALLDQSAADKSGAGSATLTYEWTTQLPLNINDSDLFPGMKETPKETGGVTEMVYVLTKYEISSVLMRNPLMRNASASAQVGRQELIEELETSLHDKYLKSCDTAVPLHNLTVNLTSMALGKMRMAPKMRTLLASMNKDSIPVEEKVRKLRGALSMLTTHNELLASGLLRPFLWHVHTNFPFPAHVYLICSLKSGVGGEEIAEEGWRQLELSHERRTNSPFNEPPKKRTPLHLAVADMTLKAWAERQKVLQQRQAHIVEPSFIPQLRENVAKMRRKKEGGVKDADSGTPDVQGSSNASTASNNGYDTFFSEGFNGNSFISGDMPMGMGMGMGMQDSFGTGLMDGFMNQAPGMEMDWSAFGDAFSAPYQNFSAGMDGF